MKTWALMYAFIWVCLVQILIVMFPVLGTFPTYDVHLVLGIIVLAMAYAIYARTKVTPCPDRIKRITKTTFGFGIFQAVLGVGLYAALYSGAAPSDFWITVLNFLHVAAAIAMITQASSSATAFDMWEEKEFETAPSVATPTAG
jgi:cytochrome b561